MIQERSVPIYDAADGKSFWKREVAEAYDKTLPFKLHFQKLFPYMDLNSTVIGFWRITTLRGSEKYIEGHESDKVHVEGHWTFEWVRGSSILAQGTPREIMQFCEKKFRDHVLRHDKSLSLDIRIEKIVSANL